MDSPVSNERSQMTSAPLRARVAYVARKIHGLGEHPLFELILELADGAPLLDRLERYASLPRDFIVGHCGDRLRPRQLVESSRDAA